MIRHWFRTILLSFVGITCSFWLAVAAQAPTPNTAGHTDWPLHNLDVTNSRYSTLNEIDTTNVAQLKEAWSFGIPKEAPIGQVTPLVVDGVMYFHFGPKLFAVSAVTGQSVWTFDASPPFSGDSMGRGPAYGDGRIYAFGQSVVYAVDAKTGKAAGEFGRLGQLSIVTEALAFKYPGKYPRELDTFKTLGYKITAPPTYFNGTLFVGLALSENLIPGGLLIAADGKTGAIKWVFNTVPQGPGDDGWELAEKTWSGSGRYGGGIWTTPAIDPALGLIYINASNPAPDYDGSARKGVNLFTNSLIALNLQTGKMAWHFQVIHHDIWDRDLVTGPTLFDVTIGGRPVKGIATIPKTCSVFLFDRQTGVPIHPIVETPVPTTTDVPGEQVWPTQPMPYTSKGVPQQPFCAIYPIVSDPELAKRVRYTWTPFSTKELFILSPGLNGGTNYGSPSFSGKTGLLYVSGKNSAYSLQLKPVGDTLKQGVGSNGRGQGHWAGYTQTGNPGVTPTMSLGAYDPATGQLVWNSEMTGAGNSGTLVTAGNVVFQGTGNGLYAFDASLGKQLFRYATKAGVRGSPLTYQVNGKQYVSVIAVDTVVTLSLP